MAELEASVREAVLALEGTVIEDFQLPLPGDLKDLAKAAALVSGIVEATGGGEGVHEGRVGPRVLRVVVSPDGRTLVSAYWR